MHGEIREIMIVLKLNGNDLSRNRISKVSVTPDARVFFFFFFFFFFFSFGQCIVEDAPSLRLLAVYVCGKLKAN